MSLEDLITLPYSSLGRPVVITTAEGTGTAILLIKDLGISETGDANHV